MVSIHRPLGYEPSALPLRHFAVLAILQTSLLFKPSIQKFIQFWALLVTYPLYMVIRVTIGA